MAAGWRTVRIALSMFFAVFLASCAIGLQENSVADVVVKTPAQQPIGTVALLFLRPVNQPSNPQLLQGYIASSVFRPEYVKRAGERTAEFMRLNKTPAIFAGEFASPNEIRAAMNAAALNGQFPMVFVPSGSTTQTEGYRVIGGTTTYRVTLFNPKLESLVEFTNWVDHNPVHSSASDAVGARMVNMLFKQGYLIGRPETLALPPGYYYQRLPETSK
jgi:hypothetical protein